MTQPQRAHCVRDVGRCRLGYCSALAIPHGALQSRLETGPLLFLTGQDFTMPPDLAPGTYRFPGTGFDGEMYRYVAHDPSGQRGYARYMDGPAQRYHRILVPALAYLLVAGRQPWIDASYIAVVALFVFLGAYWLSRWAVLAGVHPAWALAFLLCRQP